MAGKGKKPVPTLPPAPTCPSTRMVLDTRNAITVANTCVDGAAGEGIRVIRSRSVTLDHPVVKNCKGAGILDYGIEFLDIIEPVIVNNGKATLPDSLGKDTQGSGLIIQGIGTYVYGGTIADNGSDTVFEHGIYVSKLADQTIIDGTLVYGNAASGIKFAGGATVSGVLVGGSPRGIVCASLEGAKKVTVTDSHISGSTYAVMCEMGGSLVGYTFNNNTYAPGSKFRLPNGTVLNFRQWQELTGQDKDSVEA